MGCGNVAGEAGERGEGVVEATLFYTSRTSNVYSERPVTVQKAGL